VLVAAEEGVIEQHANALGLAVYANTRIKICWTVLNDHDQSAGVGAVRTTGKKQQKQECDHIHTAETATVDSWMRTSASRH